MRVLKRLWLIFAQAVTVALAALFVIATLKPQWLQAAGWRDAQPASLPALRQLAQPASPATSVLRAGFSQAARAAAPAVVSITASKAPPQAAGRAHDSLFGFPFAPRQPRGGPQRGLGSGVIISADGVLLTNNHVVDGASDIEVQLSDGRQVQARLVGTDPETDIAVLKIDLPGLPVVVLGDATTLQVGDVVLAIGNPFDVGQTVTSGIVSALGRNQLGINTFENFIQTDAAINPGNSGGALVDAGGNLIGINSAIYSRSGGNMGIGFAIPVSTARQVMDSLIRDGQVTRGWIGVEPRDLSPEIAETFNLKTRDGVLITGVLRNGPAARGGLKPGDVVTTVGTVSVGNTAQLLNAVAALKPGESAQIHVQRGDEQLTVTVVTARRPKASAKPREEDDEDVQ